MRQSRWLNGWQGCNRRLRYLATQLESVISRHCLISLLLPATFTALCKVERRDSCMMADHGRRLMSKTVYHRHCRLGRPSVVGAAFIEGFLAGSGTVLVHDADLLGVVDRWLSSLTPVAFDAALVLLRRTFGGFESAQRRQIMMLLMGQMALRDVGFGVDVDPVRSAEALRTVRHLLGLALTDVTAAPDEVPV